MIMKLLKWFIVITVGFAIYKVVGGDLGIAITAFFDFLFDLFDRTSDWAITVWNSL